MNEHTLILAMAVVQTMAGVVILLGAVAVLMACVDRRSPRLMRWLLIGLACWGAWFAWQPWAVRPDSPPALALALLVAYVLVRYAREVRGIVDGAPWWPPHTGSRT